MTEAELQRNVLSLAAMTGWLAYHTYDSRRSQAGFPDLVLVRPPVLIYAELKSEAGRLTPQQHEWMEQLLACKQIAFVWRPSDWDEIVEILKGAH